MTQNLPSSAISIAIAFALVADAPSPNGLAYGSPATTTRPPDSDSVSSRMSRAPTLWQVAVSQGGSPRVALWRDHKLVVQGDPTATASIAKALGARASIIDVWITAQGDVVVVTATKWLTLSGSKVRIRPLPRPPFTTGPAAFVRSLGARIAIVFTKTTGSQGAIALSTDNGKTFAWTAADFVFGHDLDRGVVLTKTAVHVVSATMDCRHPLWSRWSWKGRGSRLSKRDGDYLEEYGFGLGHDGSVYYATTNFDDCITQGVVGICHSEPNGRNRQITTPQPPKDRIRIAHNINRTYGIVSGTLGRLDRNGFAPLGTAPTDVKSMVIDGHGRVFVTRSQHWMLRSTLGHWVAHAFP